jgi:hypothetical protein
VLRPRPGPEALEAQVVHLEVVVVAAVVLQVHPCRALEVVEVHWARPCQALEAVVAAVQVERSWDQESPQLAKSRLG